MNRTHSISATVLLMLICVSVHAQSLKPKPPGILEQRIGVYSVADFDADKLAYKTAMESTDAGHLQRAREIRDNVVNHMIATVDFVYGNWKVALYGTDAKWKTIFDIFESVLVAGIGRTNVLSTKDDLTAILQIVRGGRASFNKNFFTSSVPMLIAAMDAGRLAKLVEIENKLATPVREYSLDEGLADVGRYFAEGSIPSAVQHLNENAATTLQSVRAQASQTRAQRTVKQ